MSNINTDIFLEDIPLIYSEKNSNKIEIINNDIDYNLNYFIKNFHSCAILNLISTLNYDIIGALDSSDQKIKLQNKLIKSHSISKINIFPSDLSKEENDFKFKLNLIKNNEENKLSINYKIKINFKKMTIILNCLETELIYDEKEDIFKLKDLDYLLWNEEINIHYCFDFGNNKIKTIVKIESDKEINSSNEPNIKKEENNLKFIISKNNEDLTDLKFIASIYFTNEYFIRILFDSKVKKNNIIFQGYDYNTGKFDESVFLYIKDSLLSKEFIYKQYLYIENESKKSVHYKIKILNAELLSNQNILEGNFIGKTIIKLDFKISKYILNHLDKANKIRI